VTGALSYGCALVILNTVRHNYKVNHNACKTHHINSYIVNITLTHRYTLCRKKTGPLQLIRHNFTNSQHLVIIFSTDRPYSILNLIS